MKYQSFARNCSLVGAALIFAACTDGESVTGPEHRIPAPAASTQEVLFCSADIAAETIVCAPQETPENPSVQRSRLRKVIIGGQGEYVNLTSSNVEVAGDIFAFDVTLENLIGQSLGTYSRTGNPHPDGVRVFFAAGPASGEGGEVQVANPDGFGTFTGTSQPYFQYEGPLNPGETTLPRRWQLQFDENVSTFNFTLYVSAEVKWQGDYVDGFPELVILDPNESRTLGELTVRTMTGRPVPGAQVTLYSADPTIITVSGSTVTASEVGSFGRPVYLRMEGDVPSNFFPARVTVVVCQSTEVGNGFARQTYLSSRSCASVFWGVDYNADLYRVALTRGQTLTVTMRAHYEFPRFDPWLELANRATGVIVATNDDDPSGVLGSGSRIVYTASETGVYVIEATSARRGEEGLYVLEVSID